MTRVLLHTDDAETAERILRAHHPDVEIATCADYDGLGDCVSTFQPDVVYSSRFSPATFPREALVGATSVKWISNAGSGCNHLLPWDPQQLTVTNSAGVAAEAMAQFALGAMLRFSMDVPGLMSDQRDRIWRARAVAPLTGKTLLLVGVGKTGQEAARLGAALGMRVTGVRRSAAPTQHLQHVYPPADISTVMADADFVLVCLPLTDQSRGLIGANALAAVKRGAVLIDLSRGGIVDMDALIDALDDGRLKGAALDVFPTEPLPADDPLWARKDILISPHCSGVYDGWEARSVEMFVANLSRWRAGETLENIVDPVAGY